jgi:hypothetical protein
VQILGLCILIACEQQRPAEPGHKRAAEVKKIVTRPSVTRQPSADLVEYKVVVYDTLTPGVVTNTTNVYDSTSNILAFRGSQYRDMPQTGVLDSVPTRFVLDWKFNTNAGTKVESQGQRRKAWGGGAGWTGQPVVVSWNGKPLECIFGSMDGNVYSLDVESGRLLRPPFETRNPIKGSVSADPAYPGMIYVGQGIRHENRSGARCVNVIDSVLYAFHSADDRDAYRRWGFFDSNPIIVDDFLFWPAENGIVYKFHRSPTGIRLHSKLIYRVKGQRELGIEASMAVYGTVGIIADNGGSIVCIDLSTLQPLWYRENSDDTDATPVVSIENDTPYVYVGCEVDKQGDSGTAYVRKLSALDGRRVWEDSQTCWSYRDSLHVLNGGMLSTPLLGRGQQSNLVISTLCRDRKGTNSGLLIAYDRSTGKRVYTTRLGSYTWSSPIAYTTKDGHMYICVGDVSGWLYFIDGANGTILFRQQIGSNFEASPVPIGNACIIASRGQSIFKCSLR